MSVLNTFANVLLHNSEGIAEAGTRAAEFGKRSVTIAGRAEKLAEQAGNLRSAAAKIQTVDRFVHKASAPVRAVGRGAASVGRGLGRTAGWLADHTNTPTLLTASVIAGTVSGVASGVRGTFKDINKRTGNAIGEYASLSVQTAFSGNPSDSRAKRVNGATGDLTLYMGRR